MESVSYDRFTTPEAEINNPGQKFIHVSGEKDCLFLFERNFCKLCFIENIDSEIKNKSISPPY